MKKLNNITLTGMPGSGKSLIGKLLARKLGFKFIDGDEYIERKEKMKLQKIIDIRGDKEFVKIEEKRILELLPLKNYVLAPGGSIIYSKKAMKILKNSSLIIFLDRPFKTIEGWLKNKTTRGIVGLKSKPLKELYGERTPLYKKYADITIDCFRKSDNQIVQEIIKNLKL